MGFEGLIFSQFQVGDTPCHLSPENLDRLVQGISYDVDLYAFACGIYERKFAPLFKDDSFRQPRQGVPYLSVRYDPKAGVVNQDQLIFG